ARASALKSICRAIEEAAKGKPSASPNPIATVSPHLDLGRLPTPSQHFVGRDAELARLEAAWEDPKVHVLTFVAFGGVGKSTLVANWLGLMAEADWRRA